MFVGHSELKKHRRFGGGEEKKVQSAPGKRSHASTRGGSDARHSPGWGEVPALALTHPARSKSKRGESPQGAKLPQRGGSVEQQTLRAKKSREVQIGICWGERGG